MRLFMEKFEDIGERETRVVKVFGNGDRYSLPADEYAFVEHYCDEKNCDCRRMMISVFARNAAKILATIALGFDSGEEDAGPYLDPLNIQSEYSAALLQLVVDVINEDPDYLARLQRHYVMYKEEIDGKRYAGKPFETPGKFRRVAKLSPSPPCPKSKHAASESTAAGQPKIGRNEPCPCGSGKKYKRCCLISSNKDKNETIEAGFGGHDC